MTAKKPLCQAISVCRDATDGANVTKDFISKKDFRTYSIIILRQEKILRDHEVGGSRPQDAGWRSPGSGIGRGNCLFSIVHVPLVDDRLRVV
jgi:hypothetical protein